MEWLRKFIVVVGSIITLIASILWVVAGGGYEAWIVSISSFTVIFLKHEYFFEFLRKRRKLSPEQKIAARDRWRPIFQEYFLEAASKGHRVGDAIIHDVIRLDNYPNLDEKKGISPWFRVGLMGTYNHGILLGLRWTHLEDIDGKWVENYKNPSKNSIKVMLLGQVPYEVIESVNFNGDDYYNKPHVYCHFDYSGQPYERLYYGEELTLGPNMLKNYREITEFKDKSKWTFWK